MHDLAVIWSGGLDSTVLMHMGREDTKRPVGLFFEWGQPSLREESAAVAKLAHRRGWTYHTLEQRMSGVRDCMRTGAGTAGPRVVPMRNLVFIARAANWCAANGIERLWYGATAEDTRDYPDCRPGFVHAVNSLTEPMGVRVSAPLVGLYRPEVLEIARRFDVDEDLTWSCYQPQAPFKPCGTCNSCRQ